MGFWCACKLQDMQDISAPTIHLSDLGELPPDIGFFPNLHISQQNTSPLPYLSTYFHTVHAEIDFGDTVVSGSIKYCLLLVDQQTKRQWIYGLKIIKGVELVHVKTSCKKKRSMYLQPQMARSYITDMRMPKYFWWWTLCHASQVSNYMPVLNNGYFFYWIFSPPMRWTA
eukprot:13311875-Ditylum_brightwellii.AAC.1